MWAAIVGRSGRAAASVAAVLFGLFIVFGTAGTAAADTSSPGDAPTAAATSTPAATQVTAVEPTWKTVGCGGMDNLITIPKVTGVQYRVNGIIAGPGDNLVANFGDDGITADVTAGALPGYVLVGQSEWNSEVPAPECVLPTVRTRCGGFTVTNKASYPVSFSWAEAGTFEWAGYQTLAPGDFTTITTKFAKLDFISSPADDGTAFSVRPLTVPQDCATPPASTPPTAPTTTTTVVSGPPIVTDGPADTSGGNGPLLLGGTACAVGVALGGFGLRRRLRR